MAANNSFTLKGRDWWLLWLVLVSTAVLFLEVAAIILWMLR